MIITSNDGSQYRTARATKALNIAIEIAGITHEQAELLIYKIMDYKGNLEIEWIVEPSQRQREAFSKAWGICGEMIDAVEHKNISTF